MIKQLLQRYLGPVMSEKDGVSSLEYAVLAVGIVIVVATAAVTLGTKVTDVFNTVGSSL